MLKQLTKLLTALNAETAPWQISLAFILGMVLGLTPLLSLHNIVILLLAFILRINFSAFLLAFAFFSGLAYLLDPLFIAAGEALLLKPELRGFWTGLYQGDLWRLAHFNHTLTLGSLVVSLAAAPPLFFLYRTLIINYRAHLLAWVRQSRVMQLLKATKLFKLYQASSNVREMIG
jgi:uncharacterized protein (TIGR03546 family)